MPQSDNPISAFPPLEDDLAFHAAVEKRLISNDTKMAVLGQRIESMELALQANTKMTEQTTELARLTNASLQRVEENTSGFVSFQNDLMAGTKIFCRIARGVSWFLKDVVDPFWKPALLVGLILYYLTHQQTLPEIMVAILKLLG